MNEKIIKNKEVNPLKNCVFAIQKEQLGGDIVNHIPLFGIKSKIPFIGTSFSRIIKILNKFYLDDNNIQIDEIISEETAKEWIIGYKEQLKKGKIQTSEIKILED